MKLSLYITSFVMLVLSAWAEEVRWEHQISSQDSNYYYYVGVGESESLNQAMEQAYLNAVKEAVREHYGFSQKISESFFETLEKSEVNSNFFMQSKDINLIGLSPVKEKITEGSGKYRVYRQVKYSKYEVAKEKRRLMLSKDNLKMNYYNSKGSKNGQITVKTIPSGSDFILTKKSGKGSIHGRGDAIINAALGEYELTLVRPGYKTYHQNIFISGKVTTHSVVLVPKTADFMVDISPATASIYLNGRIVKNNQLMKLPTRFEYKLTVEHPDYYSKSEKIELFDDVTNRIEVELRPKPSTLSIYSSVEGARVYINDRYKGKAPIRKLKVTAGRHSIKVEKNGYEVFTKTIRTLPNRDLKPVVANMKKEKKRKPSNWSFFSKSKNKHQFIYNPIVMEAGESSYYSIPIGYNYFINKYLSLGVDYRYTQIEEETSNQAIIIKDYRISAASLKLYPVNNKKVKLGLGIDANRRVLEVQEDYSSENKSKVSEASQGYSLTLQLSTNKASDFGIHLDHRQFDANDPSTSSSTLGVYFDF